MIFQLLNITQGFLLKKKTIEFNLQGINRLQNKEVLQISDVGAEDFELLHKVFVKTGIEFFNTSADKNGNYKCLIAGKPGEIFRLLTLESKKLPSEIISGYENFFTNLYNYDSKYFYIQKRKFYFNQKYIAGVVNVTPDSFSDGGVYNNTASAVDHALRLLDDGADIIDIGGESSRPGAEEVQEKEELSRVIPVIQELFKRRSEVIISIDTTKSNVAKEALAAGASIINDISALTFDHNMADVALEFDAAVILMHIKGTPRDMQKNPYYDDAVSEIYSFLKKQSDLARSKGIKNIIIDPGIGFGKRVSDNLEILNRLSEFNGIGDPVMIGLSRKSFLGKLLNLEVSKRENSTLATEMIALINGASFIRTHNVKNLAQGRYILKSIENPEIITNV